MGKTFKIAFITFFCLFLFVLLSVGAATIYFFSPAGSSTQAQSVIVVKGDTLSSISNKLAEQGLLRTAWSVKILYRLDGKNQVIQPGTYKFSQSMSPKSVLNTLFTETQDVWVTLKEGLRAEEIADELESNLHTTFSKDQFILLAKPVEGRLFPDTYLLSKDMDANAVFLKLTSTFEGKYAKAMETDGPGILPKNQTIILASLVEREGRGEKDTRMVAGILKNRIDVGMPLQVDATLQYAKGYDAVKKSWWGVPKAIDKESAGLYNTYKNLGLPPGAICNPGLISLEAALKPTPSDYLYYLHDTQGIPHYAKTYEEHQKNIETYLR